MSICRITNDEDLPACIDTHTHTHTHTRRMYLRVRISQYGVLSVSLRDEGMQMNAFVFRVPANSLACLNGHHALDLKPP